MKKIIIFTLIIVLGLGLTGCNFLNVDNTTTEPPVITTVDTDNFISITDIDGLMNMEMNKSYILEADIDLTDVEWTPIGDFNHPYLGIFDGNGHTISNLTITANNTYFAGLFGYLQGEAKDLTLTNFNIDFNTNYLTYVGSVAGYLEGNISNITADGTIDIVNSASSTFIGLLTGLSQPVLPATVTDDNFSPNVIQNCLVSGNITLDAENYGYVGGLVGKVFNTEITDNSAESNISVSGNDYQLYIGGLIGHYYGGTLAAFDKENMDKYIEISQNVAKTTILVPETSDNATIGGLIGYVNYAKIDDNAAIAEFVNVTGATLYLGGLIGENWNAFVTNAMVNTEATIANSDTITYNFGSIMGQNFTETNPDNAYYKASYTDGLVMQEQGSNCVSCDFTTATWYENSLGWTSGLYNKVITYIQDITN